MRKVKRRTIVKLKIDLPALFWACSVKSMPLNEGGRFHLMGKNESECSFGLAVQGVVDACPSVGSGSSADCRRQRADLVSGSHVPSGRLSPAGPLVNTEVRGGHKMTSQ